MQVLNQIGHIQFWGISPAINFLQKHPQQTKQTIRVLITGCSDIRHILKTMAQISTLNKYQNIEIYFHQTQKELLCRAFLFLHIIHEQNLNFDQRVQLFLDLYGNTLVKEKDAQYLNKVVPDLLNFIHDEKKTATVLRQFVNLKHIRFEQRDQMSNIVQAWTKNVDFQVQKYRDQRLRYHYKDRYDFRANLIDWDYNMMILEFAPIIHYYHYRQWRQTGVAFQNRFSIYSNPNPTLSSYIPGKKNATKQSCLVRGYWGDIICSPYFTFGVQNESSQKDKLFQKANQKYIGHAIQISEYNVRSYIQKLETLKDYVRIFEDYYRSDTRKKELQKQKQRKQQNNQIKAIKEEAEEQQDEQNERNKKQSEQQTIKQTKQQTKQQTESTQQIKPKTQQQYQERQRINRIQKDSKQVDYQAMSQPILKGFQSLGFKFFPMCVNKQQFKKKKFQQFFDVGVVGFAHTAYFNQDFNTVFKKGAQVYCETTQFLISHNKEDRIKMNTKLEQIIVAGGLKKLDDELKHHVLYTKL